MALVIVVVLGSNIATGLFINKGDAPVILNATVSIL